MKISFRDALLYGILIIIIIPLTIAIALSFRVIATDTTNEWIGFWGGYIGSILGGIITLMVMKKTLECEKKQTVYQVKIDYCYKVLEVVSEYVIICINSLNVFTSYYKIGEYVNNPAVVDAINKMSRFSCILGALLEGRKGDPNYKLISELCEKSDSITHQIDGINQMIENGVCLNEVEKEAQRTEEMLIEVQDFLQEFMRENMRY